MTIQINGIKVINRPLDVPAFLSVPRAAVASCRRFWFSHRPAEPVRTSPRDLVQASGRPCFAPTRLWDAVPSVTATLRQASDGATGKSEDRNEKQKVETRQF